MPLQHLRSDSPGLERLRNRQNQIEQQKRVVEEVQAIINQRRANQPQKLIEPKTEKSKRMKNKVPKIDLKDLVVIPSAKTERQTTTEEFEQDILLTHSDLYGKDQKDEESLQESISQVQQNSKSSEKSFYVSPYSTKVLLPKGLRTKPKKKSNFQKKAKLTSITDVQEASTDQDVKKVENSQIKYNEILKFKNQELEARTNQIQEQFKKLLNTTQIAKSTDNFYKIMDEFYSQNNKHSSPTRRLISQKHSAFEHKAAISKGGQRTLEYGIHYTSGPGLSYVIEPINGEIDYQAARRDPLKFYDEIIKQEVLQHKLKDLNGKKVEVSSKITKRKIGKILQQVELKLSEIMRSRSALSALKDMDLSAVFQDPQVKKTIEMNILNHGIELVDKDSQLSLFDKEQDNQQDEHDFKNFTQNDLITAEQAELVSKIFCALRSVALRGIQQPTEIFYEDSLTNLQHNNFVLESQKISVG